MGVSTTYEEISERLEQLDRPTQPKQINIVWVARGVVAVGRDGEDRNAVCLIGPELTSSSSVVARTMRFASWQTPSGETFKGNLIALPAGDHFRAAASTIAVELLRHDISSRPMGEVFAEVEPLVELVIRRLLLPPESVVGLIGELYVLDLILQALDSAGGLQDDPTALWRGHLQQSRDFTLGASSIEVKTTGTGVARHHFSGFSQVEAGHLEGMGNESLYLASIGLEAADTASPLSVADLADTILARVDPRWSAGAVLGKAQQKFVDRLASYGPSDCIGYRHPEMRDLDPYHRGYVTSYAPRLYDMSDSNVRILRRADLIDTWVLPIGIEFTAELPEQVPGSIENPTLDLAGSIKKMVVKLMAEKGRVKGGDR